METYHIKPTDALAVYAADEVGQYAPETWIAIRGEMDSDGWEFLYTVSAHPDQDNPTGNWAYVQAGEWLAEYNRQD